MSFCQICREELPGHQMGCPVLTGEPQPACFAPQQPQFDNNQFLLDYTRKRVLELQQYHAAKCAEALSQQEFNRYCYHEGALSVLVSMVAILLDESHVVAPSSPQEGV